MPRRLHFLLILLGGLAAAAIAWRWGAAAFRSGEPHRALAPLRDASGSIDEVVMVVIDTLRADYLSLYDQNRATSPFLAELSKNAVVFNHAVSASSSTAPAMASVFTSRYPSRHGVFTGLMAHQHLTEAHTSLVLGKIPTSYKILGELFAEHGFETKGVADNLNIGTDLGFTRGFGSFDTFRDEGAEKLNSVVGGWKFNGPKRFSYIHYMEPHSPYNPRAPWFRESSDKQQRNKNAYESEIRHIDEQFRALVERSGWRERALIIFLADHGEEFWDHKRSGHGRSLYTEVTRVPFFIYHHSLNPARVDEIVHTMDILPTVADILGWQPDPGWEGVSLLRPEAYGRPVVSELLRRPEHGRFERTSIFHENHHLIVTHRDPERIELYNLESDLPEQHDLMTIDTERRDRLLALLDAHRARKADQHEDVTVTIDSDTNSALKTLGYLQ